MNTVVAFQLFFRVGHKNGPRKLEGTETVSDTWLLGPAADGSLLSKNIRITKKTNRPFLTLVRLVQR
jgi:hypothetical protein